MGRLEGKRVVFIIAHRVFRDEEYAVPREMLEREGAEISVASSELTPATGKLGLEVLPDLLLKDVRAADFDAVVFVGGSGIKDYWSDSEALRIAKEFFESKKLTTAICSAPVILGNAGLLKSRPATCFPGDKEILESTGAQYIGMNVVVDGKVITANGPQSAADFAATIITHLQ